MPQVSQRVFEILCILNLYSVPLILLRQVPDVFEVSRLPGHSDSRIQIERRLICDIVPASIWVWISDLILFL